MRRNLILVTPVLFALHLVLSCQAGPEPEPDRPPSPSPESAALVAPFRLGTPDVVLLVTGGTNGLLEPCHCAGAMDGGFARRSGLVAEYRRAFGRVLLLDLGDGFVPDRPASLRNRYVIRFFRALEYDAVVLGDQEWAAPDEMLREVMKEKGPRFLSTTVSSRGAPDLPLASELRTRWGTGELTVFSEIHDHEFRFLPEAKRKDLDILPLPDLAARVRAESLAGRVVVVAAHGDNLQMAETARTVPADLYLWGNTMTSDPKVLRVAGKPVLKVGGDREVGVVALRLSEGRIQKMEYRVERLDRRWPSDDSVMRIYQEFMAEAMPRALARPVPESVAWVNPAECGTCHTAAYDQWAASRHAKAYETLVREKRTGDPDCVGCHTTGFGTRGGFTTRERTPHLSSVGCQMCHPVDLQAHVKRGEMPAPIDEAKCRSCHTETNDPKYEHQKRWTHTRCPK